MRIREIVEYATALAILVAVAVFYWYSRNIVCGYYELLWYRAVCTECVNTRILLIIPGVFFILVFIFGIIQTWRKKCLEKD